MITRSTLQTIHKSTRFTPLIGMLLAATSAQAAPLPTGGTTITGEVSHAETVARDIYPDQPNFYLSDAQDLFRITVTDPAAMFFRMNSVDYVGSTSSTSTITLYDAGWTKPGDMLNARYIFFQLGTGSLVSFTGILPIAAGDELILSVGSAHPLSTGSTGTYSFTIYGVTIELFDLIAAIAAIDDMVAEQGAISANEIAKSLSESLFSAVKSGLAGGDAAVSRNAGSNTARGNNGRSWFQVNYTTIDGTDLDARFPVLQGGIDFRLNNDMLLGVSLGYSDFTVTSAVSDLDGTSLSVQPYLGFQIGKTTGSVSLSFGQIDLDTTDGLGSAEGKMRALNLSLEREFNLGSAVLTGEFDAGLGRQDIDDATGTLSGLTDTHSTWSYVSLGARYEMQHGKSLVSFGGSIDYNDVGNLDNLAADHYGSDGVTGALNAGLEYSLGNGSDVYFQAEVSGLGGDAIRKSVTAGIDLRF